MSHLEEEARANSRELLQLVEECFSAFLFLLLMSAKDVASLTDSKLLKLGKLRSEHNAFGSA